MYADFTALNIRKIRAFSLWGFEPAMKNTLWSGSNSSFMGPTDFENFQIDTWTIHAFFGKGEAYDGFLPLSYHKSFRSL